MDDMVALWFGHAIEVRSSTHGVGTHVLKQQPVTSVELRETRVPGEAVQPVTSRPPQAARVARLVLKSLRL